MALCPNSVFSPRVYAQAFMDRADAGTYPPFLHFILIGRFEECSRKRDRAEQLYPKSLKPKGTKKPVAVVLHLHYQDLWSDFCERLQRLNFAFDLYVTLSGEVRSNTEITRRILADFPDANVVCLPNRGRDILPFVFLNSNGLFRGYKAICKIHTKLSPHLREGAKWRHALVAGILNDCPAISASQLGQFLADPHAGIWVADHQLLHGAKWWGANRHRVEALLLRSGAEPDLRSLTFPAGSMFWVKPEILDQLHQLKLQPSDFEPELSQLDGSTAHAVERLWGFLASRAGMRLVETSELIHEKGLAA